MTTPDASEAWLDPIFDAVVSDAQNSGYFDKVNRSEPVHMPATGLTAAVWVQGITPIEGISGLDCTSARVLFMLRIYCSLMKDNPDAIDPQLMRAASNLIRRYHGDFDFGGIIRNVDLLGSFGVKLEAVAGYYQQGPGVEWRVMDLLIPCIVTDVWPQVTRP